MAACKIPLYYKYRVTIMKASTVKATSLAAAATDKWEGYKD